MSRARREHIGFYVDRKDWEPRMPEIKAYAHSRGINIPEAILELVNKGLSHL